MKMKILMADDDTITLKMLEKCLLRYGFALAQASNGKDAVFLAKDWRPDLIILDIMMPDMDGSDAAEKLRNHPATKNIPVIFLSSLVAKNEEDGKRVMNGYTYLAKPFDERTLLAEIHRHLD